MAFHRAQVRVRFIERMARWHFYRANALAFLSSQCACTFNFANARSRLIVRMARSRFLVHMALSRFLVQMHVRMLNVRMARSHFLVHMVLLRIYRANARLRFLVHMARLPFLV